MKKLYFLLAVGLFCGGVCVAQQTQQPIQMVTYFPVPYTSYQTLNISKQCDVGLGHGCEMQVAKTLAVGTMPDAGTLKVAGDGTLDLKASGTGTNAKTMSVETGISSGSDNGTVSKITFSHNLTIDKLYPQGMGVKVTNRATIDGLKLGSLSFPQCGDSNHTISWQKLIIDGVQGIFLVCE